MEQRSHSNVVSRPAVEKDRGNWNAFLASQPEASPLALFEWRDVLAATYGPRQRYWIAESEGRVVGILPTYVTKSGRRPSLYSLRQGLCAVDDVAAQSLLGAAAEEARRLGCQAALVTSGMKVHNVGYATERRLTMILDVSAGEKSLWDGFRQKTRTAIRKGIKGGLVAHWSLDQVAEFHALYANTMASKNVPTLDRHFFDALIRGLAPNLRIFVVRKDREPVGAGALMILGDFATYAYQGTSPHHLGLAPSSFMFWSVAQRCVEEGVRLLDLGESRAGSPVFTFKANFGGVPRELGYYDLLRKPEAETRSADGSTSSESKFRLRERLLQVLPLFAKRWAADLARSRGRIV
jgi:hypothetical protein